MNPVPRNVLLPKEFLPAPAGSSFDFVRGDDQVIVNLLLVPRGVRDIHAAILRLALALADQPKISPGCLAVITPKISPARVLKEWNKAKTILRSGVGKRMTLIAVGKERDFMVEPESPTFRGLAVSLRSSLAKAPNVLLKRSERLTDKTSEVLKVLLLRWLRNLGPVAIQELERQVGCSYPTVAHFLRRLECNKILVRHSNRAVELARFPTAIWSELLALSGDIRRGWRFTDTSGHPPSAENLLRRLHRLAPLGIALSGVVAARHWHPDFNLHGTPRLDLVLHAPGGVAIVDMDFVARLDPALKRTEIDNQSAILVVHPLFRAESFFEKGTTKGFPISDPVETLLDLQELHLNEQAEELIMHFRPEAKL